MLSIISIIINKVLSLFSLRIIKLSKDNIVNDKYTLPTYGEFDSFDSQFDNSLNVKNEYLKELKYKYSQLDIPVTNHSFWSEKTLKSDEFNIKNFRGDNVFLWQYRSVGSEAELKYLLYTYYIQGIDELNLLNKLTEDNLFGVYLFDFNDKIKVSRDLLDSISEIYFLSKHIPEFVETDIRVLDIGAGYGRFAYRLCNSIDTINMVYCIDAVPESTYVCDFYLNFRNVQGKAKSVPLYEIDKKIRGQDILLAVNIHSFSECTIEAIKWWLDFVKEMNIKYLFVIPNPTENGKLLSTEKDGSSIEFLPEIISRGYNLKVKEPKFLNTNLQKLIHHTPVYYYLFELENK